MRKLMRIQWKIIYRIFESTRRPLPRIFWNVMHTNAHACGLYVPKTYPGPVTLFLPKYSVKVYSHDLLETWSKLATGRIVIHEVADDGFPGVMMKEPYVQTLAEMLSTCLTDSWTK